MKEDSKVKNFPLFCIGQLIQHNKFNYRGVVFQVDTSFKGTEEWYEQVAKSRPPKDNPWYHVLVDGSIHSTYVAERHLAVDTMKTQIKNPMLGEVFNKFEDGKYKRILN